MRRDMRVDGERMRVWFEALAEIGGTPGGGVFRPALGEMHAAARRWFLGQAARLGLEAGVDGAGNHWARLRCGPADAASLALGSHLDSVPNGGRYDGALGVVAALEVLATVRDARLSLRNDLEIFDFTDEEGHFVGLLGSRALAGVLDADQLAHPHEPAAAFSAALAAAGLSLQGILAAKRERELAGYFELHIEQGGRLAEQRVQIGVVTGIVGIRTFALTFVGRADHAGTTPLHLRRDAAQGACIFALAARELVLREYSDGVVNVGNMQFSPGVFNVVPERVTLSLEFRAKDARTLDAMEAVLLDRARGDAAQQNLELVVAPRERVEPTPSDASMQDAIGAAGDLLGLSHVRMPSGAGHDAQSLAHICPMGMIFVPSVDGRSHSPLEFTPWEDCVNGANVLLHAILRRCG